MTMWRDPLDDLINELEQALPIDPAPTTQWTSDCLVGAQLYCHAAIWGITEDAEDVARLEANPLVKRFLAYLKAQSDRRQ